LNSIRFRKEKNAGGPAERKNVKRKNRDIIDAAGYVFVNPEDPDFR